MRTKFVFVLMLLLASLSLQASNNLIWYTQDTHQKPIIKVELFLSSTCPHCHKADAFFRELEPNTPWLKVQRFIINEDKQALIRFNDLLVQQKMSDFAVPSIFFCGSRWVGFDSSSTTGKELTKALEYCKQQIEKEGTLSSATVTVLTRKANANLFNTHMDSQPTAATFITIMALTDAFNPCALFCLMAFFAFLMLQIPKRLRIISSTLFIIALGITHYLQQTNTNAFFAWYPVLYWPSLGIGLLTLVTLYQHYRMKLTSGLLIILAPLLAVVLQSFQQTCLLNWSLVFEQWLNTQDITPNALTLYQVVYQVLYIVPLFITLIAYVFLIEKKRLMNLKPILNNLGMLFLICIAILLIAYPWLLSNYMLSMLVIVVGTLCVWVVQKYKNRG